VRRRKHLVDLLFFKVVGDVSCYYYTDHQHNERYQFLCHFSPTLTEK
jgi:hypothetical protein